MRNEHIVNEQGMLDDHSIKRNQENRPAKAYHYFFGCLACLVAASRFAYGVIYFEPKWAYGACVALFLTGAISQFQQFLRKLRK